MVRVRVRASVRARGELGCNVVGLPHTAPHPLLLLHYSTMYRHDKLQLGGFKAIVLSTGMISCNVLGYSTKYRHDKLQRGGFRATVLSAGRVRTGIV